MGACIPKNDEKKGRTLSIATLNYSGVQQSPFQFYEDESENQKQLTRIFQKFCGEEYPRFKEKDFKWVFGKMDKDWHTRYSPLYMAECGVRNNRLVSKEEFEKQWETLFQKNFKQYQSKIYGKLSPQERQKTIKIDKQQCKLFDYIVYKSIVRQVCKTDKFQQADSSAYLKFMKQKFNKPFLNEQLKVKYTLKNLQQNHFDVVFLQEADEAFIGEIRKNFKDQYQVVERLKEHCTSAILMNKKTFPSNFQKENQTILKDFQKMNLEKILFINQDSVFQAIGMTVFMSVHLTSKKQLNSKQVQEFNAALEKLASCGFDFVVGCDLNTDYPINTQIHHVQHLEIFPDCKKQATVMKKRTLLQAQKHKANQLNDGVKDYFISSLGLQDSRIQTIQGKQVKKGIKLPLLPNAEHPYDHYLLSSVVRYRSQELQKK